jgi:serine/threonine-protein kinase RsbW
MPRSQRSLRSELTVDGEQIVQSIPAFSATLDSVVEAVDSAEASLCAFAAKAGFGESDVYFMGLAVREVVVNAIKHGNRFDPDKKVGLKISLVGRDLVVEVTDQGEGFRLENVPDPLAPENRERESGRGIMMATRIMDEFSVTPNSPSGSCIRMAKRLPSQER